AAVEDPAPAVVDEAVVADVAPAGEIPEPQAVSTPAPQKQAAASDNGDNAASGRATHKGARGKHAA
ncbi:MAG: hypothetical protein WCP30_17770, partial [Mycobacteriaceae bacterium]